MNYNYIAKLLASWTPESKQHMWQLSGQFEGDIILPPGTRNGIIGWQYHWNNGEIPYVLSSDFTEDEKTFIINTLQTEYARTCIKMRPKQWWELHYVYVTGKDTGCWSSVGKRWGKQELNLQKDGCLWYGTIVHEFLHAAGFFHQQSAPERDDYVTILWQNILPGKESNFNKYSSNVVTSFGKKYDYDSIMHYDKYAFSSNGEPTILPNVSILFFVKVKKQIRKRIETILHLASRSA
ncbi:hypothetical protein ILUMI_21348 [Ignelater luminosus]|uniref:Metalloendopeptidase n=1 Tax=Ignelater luminosus TaxID=2038154 RepID=A0A8K0CJ17_IGNLU|nr:hypothetical protein ILUMI_21348 [Ignelater luminosus]